MTKRKIFNTLKRRILNSFNEDHKPEKEWHKVMREEILRMAKLNGELILMSK